MMQAIYSSLLVLLLWASAFVSAQTLSPDGATLRVEKWECVAHLGRYIRCLPLTPECEKVRREYKAFWDKHQGCARREPPDCPPEKAYPTQGECYFRQFGGLD
jgi:hypothetical protein